MTKALHFSLLSYLSYLPRQPLSRDLHRPTFIPWTLQFMKLFIMHTTSDSLYFLLLGSNYFTKHPVSIIISFSIFP
jgi:hypothetical protein